MDKLSPQQRHVNMAAIRSKDTKPEMIVRKGLWRRGFRYRLNHIWLQDHSFKSKPRIARIKRIGNAPETTGTSYPQFNEEDSQMPMAAEEIHEPEISKT